MSPPWEQMQFVSNLISSKLFSLFPPVARVNGFKGRTLFSYVLCMLCLSVMITVQYKGNIQLYVAILI